MIAPHPFGHDITATNLLETFSVHKQWEDRYRQLILLAKQLLSLPEPLKQNELELTG